MGVGSDRDDIHVGRRADRPESLDVDAERHELDARVHPPLPEPLPEHVRLVLAVRQDRGRRAERPRVEPLQARRAELHEALGQSDRGIDERPSHDTGASEQHQGDAHGVDRREHDVGAVQLALRREHAGEVAAVPAGRLETPLQRGAGHTGPGRWLGSFQVVPDSVAALGELVHSVKGVAGRRARLEPERRPPVRRVAEEVEDGGHGRRG